MRRVVLIAALTAAACDQPPVKEIAAAEQEVERARAIGAERYAPERWKAAQAALALARQRVEGRDYRGALSAANDAAESARVAIENTGPAKAAARKAAEIAIGEVRTMLDRADEERTAALKAGVSRRALAALDKRSQDARQQLAAAGRALETGELEYAEQMMAELRAQATPLPDLYRGARTQWESKRPRRSRGAGPRRTRLRSASGKMRRWTRRWTRAPTLIACRTRPTSGWEDRIESRSSSASTISPDRRRLPASGPAIRNMMVSGSDWRTHAWSSATN